jgi:hypothetical protein
MSHLESPKQFINVLGTHQETHVVRDAQGNQRTETKTVTDISFKVDVTAFVSKGKHLCDILRRHPGPPAWSTKN